MWSFSALLVKSFTSSSMITPTTPPSAPPGRTRRGGAFPGGAFVERETVGGGGQLAGGRAVGGGLSGGGCLGGDSPARPRGVRAPRHPPEPGSDGARQALAAGPCHWRGPLRRAAPSRARSPPAGGRGRRWSGCEREGPRERGPPVVGMADDSCSGERGAPGGCAPFRAPARPVCPLPLDFRLSRRRHAFFDAAREAGGAQAP